MISIAKRVLLGLFGAGVALGCGNGDSSNIRHTSQALCTGACSDGPARSLFPFAGTGIAGVGSSTSSLSAAQFSSPGGVFYTVPAIGNVPANTLIIADTGNNRIRTATASSVMDIAGGAGQNLLINPGCDGPLVTGGVSGWDGPPPPGPSVPFQCYSTTSPLSSPPLSSSFHPDSFDGNLYFAGEGRSTFLQQDVPVAAYAQQIDAGSQAFILNAYGITPGSGSVEISSLDANKTTLGVTIAANSIGRFWPRLNRRLVAQIGTRFVRIKLRANAGPIAFDGLSLVAEGASPFNKPQGLATKGASTVHIADTYNDRVQALLFSGAGFSTTLSPAGLEAPTAVAVDPNNGTIYVADFNHHRIARWSGIATDTLTTFAGIGGQGWSGDGGLATAAALGFPSGVAVDSASNVYIADRSNAVIRKVGTDGKIQTIAGVAGVLANDGDGGAATTAHFIRPSAVSVGSDSALYVDDVGAHNIRKIKAGIITTVAGNGSQDSSGDNGSALLAQFNEPNAFSLDASTGNLYVADTGNQRIRVATCGDQNACTGVESYSSTSGLCVAGVALNPNDSNSCTTDTCDPLLGAVHTNVATGTSCTDGTVCNGNETCDGAGHCQAGVPLVTEDNNVCTTDGCNASSGVTHTPSPGVVCGSGSCSNGVQTLAPQCSAQGTCPASTTVPCGTYVCGASACLVACSTDAQCSTGNYCNSPNCVPRLGTGQTCTQSGQCIAGACVDGGCCDATAADPLTSVAINPLVPTDFVTQVAPIYSGSSPTQTALAGAVDPKRVAVIRGKVLTEDGAALPCAKISVVGSPNLGSTRSRGDGAFTIAVNGGATITLRVERATYLSADRKVDTSWHAYSIAQDVRLLTFGKATTVFSSATGFTTVSGDAETDGALGTRTARLLFPPSTHATVAGEATPRESVDVQVKELTNFSKVKRDGMPASLPVTSAFTYAVNLSVAGAENKTVTLTDGAGQPQAVPFYVENFLGMPIGEIVPVGYYDTNVAQWVASNNGLVIKIVSKDAGGAHLDVDKVAGVNPDADALALGITDAERQSLASLYAAGTSLWRFTTTHFSFWDLNWAWGPPGPLPDDPPPAPPVPPCGGSAAGGSIIDCEKQGLREKLPLAGTPFQLFYASNRQPGGIKPLHIPLTGVALPAGLMGVQLEIYVAGRKIVPTGFPITSPSPGMSFDFYWDGVDYTGRKLYGAQPMSTRVGFTYDGQYMQTAGFGAPGGRVSVAASNGRFEATLWQVWTGSIERWDAQQSGLGGWDIDVHHGYDPVSGTLHLGDGRDELVPATLSEFYTVAGGTTGSSNPVQQLGDIVVADDGTIYVISSPSGSDIINRIATDGSVSPIAGGNAAAVGPTFGDGGPATSAGFVTANGLALGPNQKLYVADIGHSRVRVIDLVTGVISNFAGNGTLTGQKADSVGRAATSVAIRNPRGVAVADDGTVYIAEENGIDRVRDGLLTSIVPSPLNTPVDVAVAKDGTVYFGGSGGGSTPGVIWKVDRAGTLAQVQPIPRAAWGSLKVGLRFKRA